ncbi:MAG: YggU family protein [Candidatus Latescibacterota bacterium]|nr:MAG: YggU family protein [Candidatus Latescibacterota bacterium]
MRIRVRVKPRAKEERIEGLSPDGTLVVRVAAPPERGKANERLVRILAEAFGVARSEVRVVAGHKSRDKVVEVEGVGKEVLGRLG